MPVWIAWTIPNAIGVAGILWWRWSGCGDGRNYMAVTHKMVVLGLLVPPMAKALAVQGFLEIVRRIKSVSKVVQKTGFLR